MNMTNWQTGDFSEQAWEVTAEIRQRIDGLDLLKELADGSLRADRFVEYLVQDDFYLRGYARALAMLASRAPTPSASGFWATSAGQAVAVEVEMHQALLTDPLLTGSPQANSPSPTTRGYVNFIQTAVAYDPYPVGVAAVLPCYWVYADVGIKLATQASLSKTHPYASWVAAYADPAFQQETQQAIQLLDEAAEQAPALQREAMLEAFVTATRYEELFWERSYLQERWTN